MFIADKGHHLAARAVWYEADLAKWALDVAYTGFFTTGRVLSVSSSPKLAP
ncbi:hypothetical protein [Parachlamydia sp. AcF125]|uniref:hypothetical protein n=1 Tax=Parachlamydia sp. AcF125 TaxID=2795736 RepID=UPI001BCA28B1|nr:hypothetical protein [Parachlamydia sp. AcF125]MBS4167581.1 hypothetical protein [Parachlamydia sp. AcF125]